VANQRERKQRTEIDHDRDEPVFPIAAKQRNRERRHQKRHDLDHKRVRKPRLLTENADERQQIECERQHP
jgi:hypothetical protein